VTSWRGGHAEAVAMLDEAIELVGVLGATEELADMLTRRGDCHLAAGDFAAASRDYDRVIALAKRLVAPPLLAGARLSQATIARLSGEIGEARRLVDLSLGEVGAGWFGPEWTRSQILIEAGWVACAEGDTTGAAAHLAAAMADAVRWNHMPLAGSATEAFAAVALSTGDSRHAARLLGAGVALRGVAIAEAKDVAGVSAAVVAAIGQDAFDAEYAAGRAMTRPEALRFVQSRMGS
jgi:hypothetical protein